MRKKLGVVLQPYITSRTSNAIQMSAIQALPCYCDAWLCNEFINLRYLTDDKNRCDFLQNDFWFTNAKMFHRQSLLLDKETLEYDSFDVIKYIISSIRDGMYVTGDYNAFFIPDKLEYMIMNKRDTYLIYGYDLINECFYLLENTACGYAAHEVSFRDYCLSLSNRDDGMFNINTMQYNPQYQFAFSVERFHRGLNDYLNSFDSEKLYNLNTPLYGLDCVRQLKDDVVSDYGRGQLFRDNSFLVLCEHKKLMTIRLKFLNDHTDIHTTDLIKKAEDNYLLTQEILRYGTILKQENNLSIYPLVVNSLKLLIEDEERLCQSILLRV